MNISFIPIPVGHAPDLLNDGGIVQITISGVYGLF
jgi:hypothetical protein